MLKLRLLVVEDEESLQGVIHEKIHCALKEWAFVKKGLVVLEEPEPAGEKWVGSVTEWRDAVRALTRDKDRLVFCTVDLKIPEAPGGIPDPKYGLQVVREAANLSGAERVRCCVLTGLAALELEKVLAEGGVPDVMFDFKSNDHRGFPNVVAAVKSTVLSALAELKFPGPNGAARHVLIGDSSELRDQYLSKAVHFSHPLAWGQPSLLIGAPGLGRRTFVEFVAFLADAKVRTVDLAVQSAADEKRALKTLREAAAELKGALAAPAAEVPRTLLYVRDVDLYRLVEEASDCLRPLGEILTLLDRRGASAAADRVSPPSAAPPQATSRRMGVVFSVSGRSRLRILTQRTREFVEELQNAILDGTGVPPQTLPMDPDGWVLGSSRIVHVPALAALGRGFLESVAAAHLAFRRDERLPDHGGAAVALEADVQDLLFDKTPWAAHGNLAGFLGELDQAFDEFVRTRADHQLNITRAHLGPESRKRLDVTVLNIDDVRLEFRDPSGRVLPVVQKADFKVERGELLVVLGPSGCGKSTILRMIAGLLPPTGGSLQFGELPITGPTEKIGFIFQDYSLFPWLTVRRNIEFGPRVCGVPRETYWSRVEHLLEIADLKGFEDRYPRQLSGGMQQRVAIVRCLANDPDVLLMDEPFSALDVETRWKMQDFLLKTMRLTGKTVVFVTHDIDEAVFVGDRILVASPRPLLLVKEFLVPFSPESRTGRLRTDPAFVGLVNQVRRALIEAAAQRRAENAAHTEEES